ncbi:hypothetical protein HCG69_04120 [Bacteroides sp. K03]|uniref:hypothetical protein n=1 Tax=Bacteroides TaxID=816 RepID=UPI001C8BF020|nr:MULTISPECIES: hypothetical protein [unclassified Bacteroides]MBX9187279.1 hypothetical protein [Bacteroides sp. K03]
MKTIKKLICLLFCILSLFACSKEESNPQYDPSNVLFKDIPISAIKSCVIGHWIPFRQYGGVAGITELKDIYEEYQENALIIENRATNDYTRIEIKKWIKQDDACILIGTDNTPILYMYGIKKDILSTSMGKEPSPDNMVTLSSRTK